MANTENLGEVAGIVSMVSGAKDARTASLNCYDDDDNPCHCNCECIDTNTEPGEE